MAERALKAFEDVWRVENTENKGLDRLSALIVAQTSIYFEKNTWWETFWHPKMAYQGISETAKSQKGEISLQYIGAGGPWATLIHGHLLLLVRQGLQNARSVQCQSFLWEAMGICGNLFECIYVELEEFTENKHKINNQRLNCISSGLGLVQT